MTQDELLDVIRRFEAAIARDQIPRLKSVHSAAQVLRQLKVAYRMNMTNKAAVDDKVRNLWEDDAFWQNELKRTAIGDQRRG
jgi:hypothetical protein